MVVCSSQLVVKYPTVKNRLFSVSTTTPSSCATRTTTIQLLISCVLLATGVAARAPEVVLLHGSEQLGARQRRDRAQHLRSRQRWLVAPPLAPQPQGVIVVMMPCIHPLQRQPHPIMAPLKRNGTIYHKVPLVFLGG